MNLKKTKSKTDSSTAQTANSSARGVRSYATLVSLFLPKCVLLSSVPKSCLGILRLMELNASQWFLLLENEDLQEEAGKSARRPKKRTMSGSMNAKVVNLTFRGFLFNLFSALYADRSKCLLKCPPGFVSSTKSPKQNWKKCRCREKSGDCRWSRENSIGCVALGNGAMQVKPIAVGSVLAGRRGIAVINNLRRHRISEF